MKMKSKVFVATVFILLVFALCFSNPALSAQGKTFRWRLNITNPSLESTAGKALVEMAKKVKERSGGRFVIEVFGGGALGYNPFTVHRAVKTGLLEAAETASAYISEEPVYSVFSQILLFPTAASATKALDAVGPELQKASAKHNQRLLMSYSYPTDNIATVSAPIADLASWKGKKIRAWNPVIAQWLKAVGAVPQVIKFTEKYTALATKVIEGNFSSPRGMLDTGDYEVTKYYSLWRVTVPIYFVLINKNKYDSLPGDLQAILNEEAATAQTSVRKILIESEKADFETLEKKHKMTIVPVPQQDIDQARNIAVNLWEKWVEGAGPDAQVALKKVRAALAE